MKTFIWHTDYYYYACMAETLEEAVSKVKEIYKIDLIGDEMSPTPNVILNPGECIEVEHENE
jgi:hypothetical protein